MRRVLNIVVGALLLAALPQQADATADCSSEEFGAAVNDAGAALRKLSADNTPRLQEKMSRLKAKMKWPDTGYEERAYQALQDERVASLDTDANALLARIDALGTLEPGLPPDCSRLVELQAASLELQATVKAKTAYLVTKLDQMLSDAPPLTVPKLKAADVKADPPVDASPDTRTAAESRIAVAREPVSRPPAASGWSTETSGGPPPGQLALASPPPDLPAPPPEADGYTIDEIKAASAGFFGQVSANLASVIEHVFRKSGRPTGYILGTEGGGAFLAGVRYGDGTLYMRAGGTQQIFWHGPSVGADIGGAGSKTLFLIYKVNAPEELYSNFTGVDGSAYLVGGVGATLVTNGRLIIAPIRSGIGLRLGASVGYLRFTPKATWNPF